MTITWKSIIKLNTGCRLHTKWKKSFYIGYSPVCGRTGVRLRDHQYFSDAWINQFSYPWSTVARVRGPLHATCTSPIMHLICPPKFCISIVFNSSWTAKIPRRNENKGYADFWGGRGANKVNYGRCALVAYIRAKTLDSWVESEFISIN